MSATVRIAFQRTKLRQAKLLAVPALCALFIFAAVTLASAADSDRPKRVLIISTGSRLAPGFMVVDQQLIQALAKIPTPIETYAENLDIGRFPTERFGRIFSEYLTEKYAEQPPDLIILVYVGNLGIAGKLLQQIFPGTPVVVAGFTEEEVGTDQFGPLVSGVAQRVDPRATLDLIFRLQPETRRIVVIAGTAEVDGHVLDRVKDAARSFEGKIQFDFWDNRTLAELRQALAVLPAQTVILFARMFRDGSGRAVISAEMGRSIAQWANVPVYVMTETSLGTGAVGGSVASLEAFGKRAGELARVILTGNPPASLPFEIHTESVPMFDWRALKRWGISESRLPPNSVIRFRPESLWEKYHWYILGAIFVILLQSAMIIDLLLQRRRRHRLEAELGESQQLIELAASAGELGLWSRNLTDDRVWANAPMRFLFGLGACDALRFDDLVSCVHPDDRARMLSEVASAQAAGAPFQGEFRTVLPNGEERWVLAKGRVSTDLGLSGDQRRLGVVLDITERKRAEEALENERSFLRQVIDIDPNFIFAKDREGRFTLANRAVADVYGTTVENLIGKTDADFNRNAEQVESFQLKDLEVIDTLQERFIAEEQITDSRGRVRWLQTVKRPIIQNDGSANQVLGASTEITRRKETELELQEQRAELAHVARVSMMGELAASLAHELNQPLTAILSNAQAALRFMSSKPDNLEEVREILQDIVSDNSRAAEVIRRIRALAKKEELEFATLDLASLVRDVMALVHSDAILNNVRISLELEDNLPLVRGDRVQLQQVVLNIMLNAFDAMKECPASERKVKLQAGAHGEESIKVAVSDCGTGLSGGNLEKIFQPFYTSKRDGLGMGLSICRSIIEAHGGHLWAENNNGTGAIFYFTIPVEEAGNQSSVNDDQ
jgi:two-component system, LuxR family, sensor kinase FixL